MQYECRTLLPTPTERWHLVEADSPGAAAQEYHDATLSHGLDVVFYDEEKKETVHFRRVEIKGVEGSLVSRMYKSGLRRKGGVALATTRGQKLQVVAYAIKWTGTLDELLAPWELEEQTWR